MIDKKKPQSLMEVSMSEVTIMIKVDVENPAEISRAFKAMEILRKPQDESPLPSNEDGERILLEGFEAAGDRGLNYDELARLNARAFPRRLKSATRFYRSDCDYLSYEARTPTTPARRVITEKGLERLRELRAAASA
jgi:hypothetical protein